MKQQTKRAGKASAVIIACSLLIFFSFFPANHTSTASAQEFKPAPEYRAMDLEGRQVSLADLRGEVALVNVWATWCVPCRAEMPGLQELHDEFSDRNFRVVGVSIDDAGASNRIGPFLSNMGITYTVWRDPADRFAPTFKTIGVPESFLISTDGYILYQWKGQFDPVSEDTKSRVLAAIQLGDVGSQGGSVLPPALAAPTVGMGIAFAAGLLSFLSPCVLPLIPSYAAFITGMSMEQLTSSGPASQTQRAGVASSRNTILIRGALFVTGFSIIFITLGASVAALGFFFGDFAVWIERAGGIMLIGFGLHLLGVLRIPGVEKEYFKKHFSNKPVGHVGALAVGMGFGAGWTPCIGPILASILTLAATTSTISEGIGLLGIYSAGLAIPFMVSTLALDRFLKGFQKFRRWMPWVNRASGILLIIIGIILLTGTLALLSGTFSSVGIPEISLN